MRVRMGMMGVCENWSVDPPGLHFDPQSLHSSERSLPSTALYFEPLKLPVLTISGSGSNFSSNADTASKNNVVPSLFSYKSRATLSPVNAHLLELVDDLVELVALALLVEELLALLQALVRQHLRQAVPAPTELPEQIEE